MFKPTPEIANAKRGLRDAYFNQNPADGLEVMEVSMEIF